MLADLLGDEEIANVRFDAFAAGKAADIDVEWDHRTVEERVAGGFTEITAAGDRGRAFNPRVVAEIIKLARVVALCVAAHEGGILVVVVVGCLGKNGVS